MCAFGSNISRVAAPTCTVEIIRAVVGRRIATQLVSQFAERSVRQLAKYAERGAFSERTNEIAAVARPVGMEVVTARCRNSAEEWRRREEINRRAKEVIRASQQKADEDAAARAAHNGRAVHRLYSQWSFSSIIDQIKKAKVLGHLVHVF